MGTLRRKGSSDVWYSSFFPRSGPSRGSPVLLGQSSNVAHKAHPPHQPGLCLCSASAHSSLRIAALVAFRFLKLAMCLRASGFLHILSPLPAGFFYPFCLANSHSSFGSQPQRHFLYVVLLSCPQSRNPPVEYCQREVPVSSLHVTRGLICY